MNHTLNHATATTGKRFVAPEQLLSDARLFRLVSTHEKLEQALAEELRHAHIDWDGVKLIKRRKLAVTEQLARLRNAH